MISASKTTFSQNSHKILKPKVRENLMNLRKKFCESTPLSAFLQKNYNFVRAIFGNLFSFERLERLLRNEPLKFLKCTFLLQNRS
jgi:hypothetical protein